MIGASDIPLEGALGKEGGVEQILFRGGVGVLGGKLRWK